MQQYLALFKSCFERIQHKIKAANNVRTHLEYVINLTTIN